MSQTFDNVSHVYLMRKLQKYAKKNPQQTKAGKKTIARLAGWAVGRYIAQKATVGFQFLAYFCNALIYSP